jgi:tripartite-type tricarboxylate transporter receptor subunit TctC
MKMTKEAVMNASDLKRVRSSVVAAVIAVLCLPLAAAAQGYPNKPIRFIVPFQAGSAPDHIARVVGMHMQQTLGQPIVIDNKPGAQGAIAAAEAAKAAPDGYTVFGGNNTTLAANPSLYKKLPYDPAKDFIPVARFITGSLTLVVKADFPAQNTKEFLALVKSKKGAMSVGYASAGMQVAMAELKSLGGVELLEVPYKGVPQAVNDVLGGQLTFTFADNAVAFTQIRGGKLKGFGITAKARTQLMPEMPSLAEEMPGFDVTVWSGLAVPAGTPRDVIDKLWAASQKALAAPEVTSRLMSLGLEPALMGPEEFGKFVTAETAKWARQIKQAGIQPE